MSALPASARPRKRTKTFTGCWTCRARKIKCDEAKPSCNQCHEKGISCEGYSTRLQWLTPVTDQQGLHSEDLPKGSMSQSLRRLLPAAPLQSTLEVDQVDDILRYLDSLESIINTRREDVRANIHNFGVFSFPQESIPTLVDGRNAVAPCTPKACQLEDGYEFSFDPDPVFIDSDPSHDNSEVEVAWNLCNRHEQQLSLIFPQQQQDLATFAISPRLRVDSNSNTPGNAVQWKPLEPGDSISSGAADNSFTKTQQPFAPLNNTLENLVVPSRERFLMSHYINRVVNLFCVIDNTKSPWKTIHLPRVLQSVGEMSFGDTTTRIRNALRKSLLSISAFYLSNEHRTHHRSDEVENWAMIASRYRCDAIGLLKYAVEADLYAETRPKYKEFLATMLSMITINVMSGDTSTCGVHLDGAEKLISHMNTRKSSFSRKAQSLHRIYFYLRVIYESTSVKRVERGTSRFSPSLGSQTTFGPQPAVPKQQIFIEDDERPSSMTSMGAIETAMDSVESGMSAYECIYGIPRSLLVLLKESIEVMDEVNSYRTNVGDMSIPDSLNYVCDELEQKIMDWPLEERLHRCKESPDGVSATIIYHQTRAFLNALIIFFSQSVRLMSHRYLRQYVQAILDSIEAIEQLKAETNILAAPLFWPAFMGATEAFEPRQQERFRQWYGRVEVYGIEAVRTGIQVVHEVWNLGPTANRQINSGWRSVVERRGDCLMLT